MDEDLKYEKQQEKLAKKDERKWLKSEKKLAKKDEKKWLKEQKKLDKIPYSKTYEETIGVVKMSDREYKDYKSLSEEGKKSYWKGRKEIQKKYPKFYD